jgi:chromosome segregation ATPase
MSAAAAIRRNNSRNVKINSTPSPSTNRTVDNRQQFRNLSEFNRHIVGLHEERINNLYKFIDENNFNDYKPIMLSMVDNMEEIKSTIEQLKEGMKNIEKKVEDLSEQVTDNKNTNIQLEGRMNLLNGELLKMKEEFANFTATQDKTITEEAATTTEDITQDTIEETTQETVTTTPSEEAAEATEEITASSNEEPAEATEETVTTRRSDGKDHCTIK